MEVVVAVGFAAWLVWVAGEHRWRRADLDRAASDAAIVAELAIHTTVRDGRDYPPY